MSIFPSLTSRGRRARCIPKGVIACLREDKPSLGSAMAPMSLSKVMASVIWRRESERGRGGGRRQRRASLVLERAARDRSVRTPLGRLTPGRRTGDRHPPGTRVASLGRDIPLNGGWPSTRRGTDASRFLSSLVLKRVREGKGGREGCSPARPFRWVKEALEQAMVVRLDSCAMGSNLISLTNPESMT
jgi:hypothetical protein